ncbi:MAG TPA: trehalose-phosphatase [Alphaproteobacteria bacterium]|nr:trehalose-phosphatase [Alphaproteobacteria bacterium]
MTAHRNERPSAATPPGPFEGWALFLDVDGTLLDIAPEPDAVAVPPNLAAVLAALSARLGGALALVSGRAVADLDRLFLPLVLPAAGQHGGELRRAAGGPVERAGREPGLDAVQAAARGFAAGCPGILVEDKGTSVAVHYRDAPWAAPNLLDALERAVAPAGERLHIMRGKMVLEVKAKGTDKGAALRAFMTAPPFAGRVPVFIGDDVTDRDGFRAAEALGGHGVEVAPRPTGAARFRLDDPAAVRAWLAGLAEGAEA